MKILHLIGGDLNGGAARGAYWLHTALRSLGVNSRILTNSRSTINDENVASVLKSRTDKLLNIIRAQLDSNLPSIFHRNRRKIIFSTGMVGYDFTHLKEYKEADVIHLHWINAGFVNIKHLSKVNKPIAWTMRDMWPMTGGCHCAMGCERYKFGCGKCEQLNSNSSFDLSKVVFNRKKRYLPKSIKMIGISHWLSDRAKESSLFRDFDVRTIYNNVNTDEFLPIAKDTAKNILGIRTNKKIICVQNSKAIYKGFDKFLEAVNSLDREKYFLLLFGDYNDKDIKKVWGGEYEILGFLYDNISLRLVYSAADVFVAPSVMEAFGKTLVESMACGTPVVCFDATGPREIVDHKINGYKAKPFDTRDLAYGIEWIINNSNFEELCRNAREKVVREFDSKIVAKRYIELYEEVSGR